MKVYKKFLFQKMSSQGRNMGQNLHLLQGSIPQEQEEIKRQKLTSNQKNTNQK